MNALTDSKTLLGMARSLPPLPASTTRLAQLAGSPDCDLGAVADVIRRDPALTLKLLNAANSAASASSNPIGTVDEAVMRLGTGLIVSLAFSVSVGPTISQAVPEYDLAAGALGRHSVAAATAAENLLRLTGDVLPPETVTAALLHDVGKLILARHAPPEYLTYLRSALSQHAPSLHQAEREVLELHHGEVGALVAQHWKLPDRICRAIMYHHEPEQWDDPICFGVHVADLTAHAIEADPNTQPPPATPSAEVLERLELTELNFEDFVTRCRARFEELRPCYGL